MQRDDGRLSEAKAIPILEVAERLGVSGLNSAGGERVGPCPVCGDGGKGDANRFAINPRIGVFLCRKCNRAGDGLELVQFVHGCDFKAALAWLVGDAPAAVDPAEVARRRAKAEAAEARRRDFEARARAFAIRDAREIWRRAQPAEGTPVAEYLAGRGIRFRHWPPTLLYLPDHPYRRQIGGKLQTLHSGPAMIAPIQGPTGRVVAVHQTWIDPASPGKKAAIVDPDGKPLPAKMVRGSKKGGAIRLSPLGGSGVLIMGEGVETTASALVAGVMPAAAFWAGVDLGNMAGRQVRVKGTRNSGMPDLTDDAAWVPPEGIKRLIFIQDGDSDPKATRAKLEAGLRRAACVRPGLQGAIVHPGIGRDLNDLLQDHDGGENDNER